MEYHFAHIIEWLKQDQNSHVLTWFFSTDYEDGHDAYIFGEKE